MHLNLDEFNVLIEGKVSGTERHELAEHVIHCERCKNDFNMLVDLRDEMVVTQRVERRPWKYALGAAAVLLMASWPVLDQKKNDQVVSVEQQIVSAVPGEQELKSFSVIDEIECINYKNNLSKWGTQSNIQDLVKSKNRS